MQLKLSESMLRKLSDTLGFEVTEVIEQDGNLLIYGCVCGRVAEGSFFIDFAECKFKISVYNIDDDFLDEEMEVLLDF